MRCAANRAPILALVALLSDALPGQAQPLRDYTVVHEQTFEDSDDSKSLHAECPEGTSILGGGVQTGPYAQALDSAIPTADRRWTAVAYETVATDQLWRLIATAICGNVADYDRIQDQTEHDSLNPKGLTVQCPEGTSVLGGGANAQSPIGSNVALTSSTPDGNGWYARAYEVEPTNLSWHLTVQVMCGNVNGRVVVSEYSSASSEDGRYVTAACPGRKVALSGGTFVGISGFEVLSMSNLLGDGWRSYAFEPISHDQIWTLRSDVICVPEPRSLLLGLAAFAMLSGAARRTRSA